MVAVVEPCSIALKVAFGGEERMKRAVKHVFRVSASSTSDERGLPKGSATATMTF